MTNRRLSVLTIIFYAVFLGYICLFFYGLFFNRAIHGYIPYRSFNLIPFDSIDNYLSGTSQSLALYNVWGNVILFIPLGVYLPLLRKDKRLGTNLLLIAVISFTVEIAQWLFGLGATDIDDLILNTLGGLLGIILYKFIARLSGNWRRTRNAVTMLSLVVGLPVIFVFLILFVVNW